MAQTSNKKTKHLHVLHEPLHLPGLEDGEHGLAHVQGVAPVVVLDWAVVLLHAERPPAHHVVGDGELVHQVKVHEHPEDNLESGAVPEDGVIELVAVEVELLGGGDVLPGQPHGVVVAGRGVVGQAVKGHALRHEEVLGVAYRFCCVGVCGPVSLILRGV